MSDNAKLIMHSDCPYCGGNDPACEWYPSQQTPVEPIVAGLRRLGAVYPTVDGREYALPAADLIVELRARIADLERAALPREPTEAMQRAMVDAMFDEGGDLKWRELAKIARKGWRAAYDTAMPAKVDGGAKERLGLWQVQGYTATDAAQPPSAPDALTAMRSK